MATTLEGKYSQYLDGKYATIKVCYDSDGSCSTLEPQLLKANSLASLNSILGRTFADESKLLKYMSRNKTDCALKMFETTQSWTTPPYIADAIS